MGSKLIHNSVIVTVLIILGKISSFLRDVFISKVYGASDSTDAFFVANNIPGILYAGFILSILMFFIPLYTEKREKFGKDQADLFVSNLWALLLICATFLSLTGFFISPFITKIAAPGFSGEKLALTIKFSRIMVLSFPFTATILLFSSLQNANGKFAIAQTPTLFSSLIILLGIFLFSQSYGVVALVWSSIIATIFNAALQYISSIGIYRHIWEFKLITPELKKMFFLAFPVFIGLTADEINIFVNGVICSSLPDGSVSYLNYSQRLLQTINGTFVTGTLVVLYPFFSVLAARANYCEVNRIMCKSIRVVTIILLPVVIIFFFYSYEVVRLVFFRGNFSLVALSETSAVLQFYSLSILFLAYRELFNRIFYTFQDAKTPAYVGVCSVILNIILSLILVKLYGVCGLAMSAAIASLFTTLLLYQQLKKKLSSCEVYILFDNRFLLGTFLASLSMVLCVIFLEKFIPSFNKFSFLFEILFSMLIYSLILVSFRLQEVTFFVDMIKTRLSRK